MSEDELSERIIRLGIFLPAASIQRLYEGLPPASVSPMRQEGRAEVFDIWPAGLGWVSPPAIAIQVRAHAQAPQTLLPGDGRDAMHPQPQDALLLRCRDWDSVLDWLSEQEDDLGAVDIVFLHVGSKEPQVEPQPRSSIVLCHPTHLDAIVLPGLKAALRMVMTRWQALAVE